jgi:hypothetical protein
MKALALALVLCCLSASCVKRVPLTPVETVKLDMAQALGALAEANRAATSLVISLNSAGAVSNSTTRSILAYNKTVASAVKTAVTIQQGTASDADKAASIVALMRTITLPADIKTFAYSQNASGQVAVLIGLLSATINGVRGLMGGV